MQETRYFGTWLVRILINNCNNIRKSNGQPWLNEDGTWNFKKDTYAPVPSQGYDLQMDDYSFYLDQPENLSGEKRLRSFFYRTMEKGESLDYTLIFVVDADRVQGDNLDNILLQFDGTGNDPTNPMWSALGEVK